jgi:hypothetical protein
MTAERNFEEELAALINRYSLENSSNTPDFILALAARRFLEVVNGLVQQRDRWYNVDRRPLPTANYTEREEMLAMWFRGAVNDCFGIKREGQRLMAEAIALSGRTIAACALGEKIHTELAVIFSCSSPDGSAELDQARLARDRSGKMHKLLSQLIVAARSFEDPEGNMPEDTGEFRELKKAANEAETYLMGGPE